MLAVNVDDLLKVLKSVSPYLIAIGIELIVLIGLSIYFRKIKLEVSKRKLSMSILWLMFGLVILLNINLMLRGPLKTTISLATGNGVITKESLDEAKLLGEEVAKEGIVLLKNDENVLPLEKGSKLNVFGWSSTNPIYGGTGSGGLNDSFPTVSLLEGLKNSGFDVNEDLVKFYTDFRDKRPTVGMWGQDWTIPEPEISKYQESNIFENAKSYSDKAVVVIARSGGEGADLPYSLDPNAEDNFVDGGTFGSSGVRFSDQKDDLIVSKSYLQISEREKAMLEEVNKNFKNVVVIINSANTMELGFTKEYENIKSVIWCPGAGQTGFNALGKILNGEVNPSGKTSDTFVYDLTKTPAYNNFGNFEYTNMDEFMTDDRGKKYKAHFVNYVEGIYVGYRFWETASKEGFIDYDNFVQYPFGYGLSYTKFDRKMEELAESNGEITVTVTVTNTGNVAGKDVVEIYYNPPYTNGGIEKASANLIAFAKTKELAPSESETVKLKFNAYDMASYDYIKTKAYVLEKGKYEISLQTDSHNIVDTKIYNVDEDTFYTDNNRRISDKVAATNLLDDMRGDVVYLSRKNKFENYDEATKAPASYVLPENLKAEYTNNSNYDATKYNKESDIAPTTGKSSKIKLLALRGAKYDDPNWDTLLDKLSVSDMNSLIALGGYQTAAISSIGKVQTVDCDGPSSINNNFTKKGSIGLPATVMLANTFNKELGYKFGESIGKMADEMKVSGWYAPAMNTHRSAFAGRNFEYFSEDPILAGSMAAEEVKGAALHGVYAYIKHFALNDQESARNYQLMTWANEQSVREIYLAPFEICVKDGGAMAVMSAFNHYGITPAYASNEVLNKILRDEWGFKGFVLTDYFGVYGYMNADRAIRNGNDICLTAIDTGSNYVKDTTSATSLLAMRKAVHNILYTTVNSRAYSPENLNTGLMSWEIALLVIDVVVCIGGVLLLHKIINDYKKRENMDIS